MFNLVGRNLTISVSKTTSIHRLTARPLSSSPVATHPDSVKNSTINNSFTVSYLINSCGFPPEKAISASKYLTLKTPNRADSVIAFFKDQGFTEPQIFDLVRKFPVALTCNPQTNLLPKFEFLSSIGLSDSDIVKLLTARPKSLGRSLKNHLEPTFKSLKDLLQSNDRTLIAIKRCAWVLDGDFESFMIPKMKYLRDVGVPGSKMLYVLTYQPRDFLVSNEQFKKVVEEIVEMGFDPQKTNFMLAVHALRSMSKPTWEKKIQAYEKWAWSKDEIMAAFRADPWCMMKSEEKIDKVMDFLVNKMGFERSIIARNSILLSLSMEKRIIPRCSAYQYMLDNGAMKHGRNFCFSWWLKCSESIFIDRLTRYEKEAPGVLKFYQEKLDFAK